MISVKRLMTSIREQATLRKTWIPSGVYELKVCSRRSWMYNICQYGFFLWWSLDIWIGIWLEICLFAWMVPLILKEAELCAYQKVQLLNTDQYAYFDKVREVEVRLQFLELSSGYQPYPRTSFISLHVNICRLIEFLRVLAVSTNLEATLCISPYLPFVFHNLRIYIILRNFTHVHSRDTKSRFL